MLTTPLSLGYRMPAEWEKHEATWLAWPKDPTTFPPDIIGSVETTYTEMVSKLAPGERVDILVDDGESEARISSMLGRSDSVRFRRIKSTDVWIRDYGPIFVKNGAVAATKWQFNAWGEKYEELKADDETGKRVALSTGLKIFEPGVVLEGGSIDVNGSGSCLTTKQCLLNPNRNPALDKEKIEWYLHEYLGVTRLIWLDSGISGDDTDGHVDDVARFVNENTIICMVEEDRGDDNYGPLQKNYRALLEARDQSGRKFEVIPIKMPKKVDSKEGRLPASYANFYIGNEAVLVPTFNDRNDKGALRAIENLFDNREVVGIDCRSLVYGLGAIHCVTQQQPAS